MKKFSLALKRKVLVMQPDSNTEPYQKGLPYRIKIDGKFINWYCLGFADDLKEEDVKDVVEPPIPKWDVDKVYYLDYRYEGYYDLKFALESFNSALEKEIYWVNPLGRLVLWGEKEWTPEKSKQWHKFESRTFDRTRSIIFVEN